MITIAVACLKGGTAKTTTSIALAQALTNTGENVLLVDMDSQGSATDVLHTDCTQGGLYEVFQDCTQPPHIQHVSEPDNHSSGRLDLLSADMRLAGVESELASKAGRDFLLKRGLEHVEGKYSCCFLDTPPGLGTILVNALTASDFVLIPVQADKFALSSLRQMASTIHEIASYINRDLRVAGAVITRYNGRAKLSQQIRVSIGETCQALGFPLFQTVIREGVAVREAQTVQESLFHYAPKAKPTLDYLALLDELITTLPIPIHNNREAEKGDE